MLLLKSFGSLALAASIVSGKTHTVGVGAINGHGFDIEEFNATVGDIIRFEFWPRNHSIARAEYMKPCQPIDVSNSDKSPSFWDGFHPVDDGEKKPFFEVEVNTTDPIFYYCAQDDSCVGYGMIGVAWVNNNTMDPTGKKYDFAAHKEARKKFTTELHPGEPFLSEGGESAGVGAGANSTDSTEDGGDKKKLGGGAIAGIAIGAVAGIAIIGVLIWLLKRNKSLSQTLRYSRPPPGKVAPLPAMSEGSNGPASPYAPSSFPTSPAFPTETKMANVMVTPAPGYNHQDNNQHAHQSWMSASPTMRAQSPDSMAERGYQNGGTMSPNAFSPHNSYLPQQHQPMPQHNSGSYHMQSSPSETPWSPGGYNWQNVQPQHEMGAGQEDIVMQRQSQMPQGNNGYPTPSHVAAPVELAGDTSNNVVSAAPPVYRPPADGETVQKPEDKTPAVTTRDA